MPTNIAAISPVAGRHTKGFADPAGINLPAVRPIRGNVERRFRTLIDRLGIPKPGSALQQSAC